jgi:hypothetical protein
VIRIALLAAVAVVALAATSIAAAAFASSVSAGAMTVATARLEAPAGLDADQVDCRNNKDVKVGVSWSSSSSVAGGYRVERATEGGGYATIANLSAEATSYTDTGLEYSTTYTYVVRAVRGAWTTASGSSTVTTLGRHCRAGSGDAAQPTA